MASSMRVRASVCMCMRAVLLLRAPLHGRRRTRYSTGPPLYSGLVPSRFTLTPNTLHMNLVLRAQPQPWLHQAQQPAASQPGPRVQRTRVRAGMRATRNPTPPPVVHVRPQALEVEQHQRAA